MNLGYYSLSVVSAKYRDLFEKGRKNGEIWTENDDITTYGYDSLPNVYDTCDIDPAKIVGTVKISQEQIEAI